MQTKRHLVPCFYFNKFGKCKFGEYCAYRHNKRKEQVLKEEIEILKNVVNDMKKELHENKQSENHLAVTSVIKYTKWKRN